MTSIDEIKSQTPPMVTKYAERSNSRAFIQILNTYIPFFALFYLAMMALEDSSYWLASAYILIISAFIVRIFMLMHDCGHKSLFRTQWLNSFFGFFSGVFCGMPGYVWAQHHAYHHSTNGNWSKYRGPLSTLSIDEFESLSPARQKIYQYSRHLLMAPVGAFLYFIFNPRFNWALGTLKFLAYLIVAKIKNIRTPIMTLSRNYESRLWKDGAEYWHMFGNNVVLLSIWAAASWYFGAATFFTVYLVTLTLAGAVGIIIFTIQHNFEDSYAADDAHWDYFEGSIHGTSYLTLPRIVNWFSADIAYHHIHHLSSRIPNYNLEACHKEYASLFGEVRRLRLADIPNAFKHILWDNKKLKIISIQQYRAQQAA